jgi:hypothetical protein
MERAAIAKHTTALRQRIHTPNQPAGAHANVLGNSPSSVPVYYKATPALRGGRRKSNCERHIR